MTFRRVCLAVLVLVAVVGCTSRVDKIEVSSKFVTGEPTAVTGGLGAVMNSAPQSDQAAAYEEQFFDLTNRDRGAAGAPPLARDAGLTAYARNHAVAMAAGNKIFHSDIASLLTAWWTIGENVGYGPNAVRTQAAYEGSPSHYKNLTNPVYTSTGIGVYIDSGKRVYSVLVFTAR